MNTYRRTVAVLAMCAAGLGGSPAADTAKVEPKQPALEDKVTQGALRIRRKDGSIVECPLKHTDVDTRITGFIARVKVTQTFHNPLDEKIEAVYVFPLPHKAAVDGMTMIMPDRRVIGIIQRREVAREIYEEALQHGRTAALLEQERPNIFTQSVGNIPPGQQIKIEITYLDVLAYDMGVYTFHFPMVVGPRFIPGGPSSNPPALPAELQGATSGVAPPTDRVPDANRITPPVLKPGMRNGHDIALAVTMDAGVPVQDLKVINHKADLEKTGASTALVKLDPADSIPNKDFELRYKVTGKKPEMAVLSHTDGYGVGYFMLMIQPKEDEKLSKAPPREIYFVIDVSGSMRGKPTEQVKRAMKHFFRLCKSEDTMQVVTFSGRAEQLFEKAVPIDDRHIERALDFTQGIKAGGGTYMLQGIKKVMDAPADPKRVRIAVMLTDGYIGNEAEIIAEVGRRCGDQIRFWCLGVGNSVNRFLLDGVAKQGGGMSKVLSLKEDPAETVQGIMERIHRAQLANISIDWGSAPVYGTYPARIPELWAGRPVILFGRYEEGTRAGIRISGTVEGEPADWPLAVDFPKNQPENLVLGKIWARHKIEDLMHQTYYAGSPYVKEEVTRIALDHRLMSQYTSFIAIDERDLPAAQERRARPPRRMLVPVPLPEGKSWSGIFGAIGGMAPEGAADRDSPVAAGWSGARTKYAGGRLAADRLARISPVLGIPASQGPATPGRRSRLRGYYGGAEKESKSRGRYRPFSPRRRSPADPAVMLAEPDEGSIAPAARAIANAAGEALQLQQNALQQRGAEVHKLATAVLDRAAAIEKDSKHAEAEPLYAFAYLLDSSLNILNPYRQGLGRKCLNGLEHAREEQREQWIKLIPGLGKKVKLILRDVSVTEALAQIAHQAGLVAECVPGSDRDAAESIGRRTLRITYLDLTNIKTADALDWLLRPVRMTWRVERTADGPVVRAGTVRRMAGKSAWVYDLTSIAAPLPDELGKEKDYQKRVGSAKALADELATGVRNALGLKADEALWYLPGRLLVFADLATHEKATKLLAMLANADTEPPAELAKLHEKTARRAKELSDDIEKQIDRRETGILAARLTSYSRQLLAAAAGGNVDEEALAELEIAWRSDLMASYLGSGVPTAALRSAWAVSEAARALSDSTELQALSSHVLECVAPVALRSLEAARKQRESVPGVSSLLLAALTLRTDREFIADARSVLAPKPDDSQTAALRSIATALLAAPGTADADALSGLIKSRLKGDDAVALLAMACRRAGGETWEMFRRERHELLGGQPLSGSTVVLVNRLDRTPLKLVSE